LLSSMFGLVCVLFSQCIRVYILCKNFVIGLVRAL
jgi:hypothetical protein